MYRVIYKYKQAYPIDKRQGGDQNEIKMVALTDYEWNDLNRKIRWMKLIDLTGWTQEENEMCLQEEK